LGLIALSRPTVALIYQHGRFQETDTHATASALILYSLGLWAYSAVKVLVPVFYALGNSRVPVVISALTVALNILLNLALVNFLGYSGLALGTSLTAIGNFLLLFFWLQRQSGPLEFGTILMTFLKVTLASVIMGGVCFYFHHWLFQLSYATILWRAFVLGASICVGVMVLVSVCRVLRVSEVDAALKLVWKRLS
jgi:putative peptidoglycan lipid II flippase